MSSSNDCWDTVFLFKGSIKTACLMIASFSGNFFVDDCLAVDLENSEFQKSDKELFIGFAAMQCIQKNNMEGTSGVSIFRKEVRSFYVGS
jgi:hypothetical protein